MVYLYGRMQVSSSLVSDNRIKNAQTLYKVYNLVLGRTLNLLILRYMTQFILRLACSTSSSAVLVSRLEGFLNFGLISI
jgi:hypothetical protein